MCDVINECPSYLFAVVIAGVQLMLEWYDTSISDRYKLIDFKDSDNMKEVVMPINYFTSITIPVLIGNSLVFLACFF